MELTRDNIFTTLCTDYRTHFGIDIVSESTSEAGILKLCGKYNPPFVRAMWVHYIENSREERGGWGFTSFLTEHRLNQYARKAYAVMHQNDPVVEETCYCYRCEKCGSDNNMYTLDKRESLAQPCNHGDCRGRMVYDRVMGG